MPHINSLNARFTSALTHAASIGLMLIGAFLCSCSHTAKKYTTEAGTHLQFPSPASSDQVPEKLATLNPWEVWSVGRDVDGQHIISSGILLGDEYVKHDERKRALDQYLSVNRTALPPNEQEALVLRIAAEQLSLDQPELALSTLSDYFRVRRLGVEGVSAPFSVLFAYAYGRKGDIAQSLAWFSRSATLASGAAAYYQEPAKIGAVSLLSAVPQNRFEELAQAWEGDSFISSMAAQARFRRVREGQSISTAPKRMFAEFFGDTQSILPSVETGGAPTIGVLVPLSGQFGALGTSLKNGIEMASLGQSLAEGADAASDTNVQFIFKDSSADPVQAVATARELVSSTPVSVVLGPLLTDAASSVADLARQQHFPLISFSKREDFATGGGVFRLGPTAESQVESLLNRLGETRHLTRFAAVCPDDANGREFADVFRRELGKRGLSLVLETFYPKDALNSFVTLAPEVEQAAPQAIFFPDNVLSASRFFGSLTPQLRRRILALGTASWDTPELMQSGGVLNGAIFVNPFFKKSSTPLVGRFIESYRARYGSNPDFLAAQGFDAATIALAGIKRTENEGLPFENALVGLAPYDGLTGRISVQPNGELTREFAVVRMLDDRFEELTSASEAPSEGITPNATPAEKPPVPSFVLHGNEPVASASPTATPALEESPATLGSIAPRG